MGRKNYLVEGVSTSGKTSVCDELLRRGYHAVHGDRQLAYRGDPATGATVETSGHENHLWDVAKVRALIADKSVEATFFCGGSRNYPAFIELFDAVFVLTIDRGTLLQRLDGRPDEEFGARPDERALVERLHASGQDTPEGIAIDATAPLKRVVDDILRSSQNYRQAMELRRSGDSDCRRFEAELDDGPAVVNQGGNIRVALRAASVGAVKTVVTAAPGVAKRVGVRFKS